MHKSPVELAAVAILLSHPDKEDLAANEPDDSAPVASALQEPPDRDEGAALEEAARDLIRLNRCERRHGRSRSVPSAPS